jgi:C-terminal processing protease CtpA/Prc
MYRLNGELQIVATSGANPDLRRLFVLTTASSASASESLVCGLKPYMDVILVGAQTSGKYCAGYLMDATKWYDEVKNSLEEGEYDKAKPYVTNWGMYVMYSRYADCNGVTLSMPDGIAPDVEVDDNPLDGHPLGDPSETMLAAALSLIDGRTRSMDAPLSPALTPVPDAPRRPGFGVLVGEINR